MDNLGIEQSRVNEVRSEVSSFIKDVSGSESDISLDSVINELLSEPRQISDLESRINADFGISFTREEIDSISTGTVAQLMELVSKKIGW